MLLYNNLILEESKKVIDSKLITYEYLKKTISLIKLNKDGSLIARFRNGV